MNFYNKSQANTLFDLKANKLDVLTKAESEHNTGLILLAVNVKQDYISNHTANNFSLFTDNNKMNALKGGPDIILTKIIDSTLPLNTDDILISFDRTYLTNLILKSDKTTTYTKTDK